MNLSTSSMHIVVAAIGAFLLQAAAGAQQPGGVGIPAEVLNEMGRTGQASYLVVLREKADLTAAGSLADREVRGRFVYQALRAAADRAQPPLIALIAGEAAAGRVRQVRTFFSVNALGVTSTEAALRRLAASPQVESIMPLVVASIPPPVPGAPQAIIQSVEWNIAKVRAPEVWAGGFTGQGIVVANIDTGVQFDHPALVGHYRGNTGGGVQHDYNWWDATGTCRFVPCDDNGHGTHTMGTIVGGDGGANQIGVAPGATWIACKALSGDGLSSLFDILECGDWILAPRNLAGTNPDPNRRPHVVNNSWGFLFGGFPIVQTMVQSWRAAGIFPAFAAGNNGPSCGTATSPGDYPESFATGATDLNDAIASFSSRGPSPFGGIKPDISAPGVDVRSSVPGNGYAVFSGTSMASPHTAGVVALTWSRYPALTRDIASTIRMLRPAAEILNSAQGCGGAAANAHPNQVYGWGRTDALQTQTPFQVYTDRSVYQVGNTMTTSVSLINPFATAWVVDAYLGIQVPGGQTSMSPLGTITLAPSSKVFDVPVFTGRLAGTEPPGAYRWFTLLAIPGTTPTVPANLLSVDLAPFSVP